MGLLDSVIGMVAGQQGGAGAAAGGGNAELLRVVVSMLANNSQTGGLGGLVEKFQQAGLGGAIGSWIGTGQNQPVSPGQVTNALGPDVLSQIAAQLGLTHEEAATQVAQVLPQVVDHATPEGQVPSGGLGELGALLGQLSAR